MPVEITMPQLSDTMTEGTVVKWRKQEGEKIKAGDTLADIETDKAVMESEAFDSGTLAAILVTEGQKAPVGAVLAVIARANEDVAAVKKQFAGGAGAKAAPKPATPPAATKPPAAQAPPPPPSPTGVPITTRPTSAAPAAPPTGAKPQAAPSAAGKSTGTYQYDIVVIGGGPAGYAAAIRAGQLKKKVLCVEKENLGGTCLNWGCIPTKALLEDGAFVRRLRHEPEKHGVKIQGLEIDFSAMIARSRGIANQLARGIGTLFSSNQVQHEEGVGQLLGPHRVKIAGRNGTKEVTAEHVIIAVGARPTPLPGVTFDGQKIITSREAMTLPKQPKRLAIIGAGAIGCEFADFYHAIGTEVSIVEMLPTLLPNEDEDISRILKQSFEKRGINVRLETKTDKVETTADGVKLTLSGKSPGTIEADAVLVAIGVTGNLEGLVGPDCKLEIVRNRVKTDHDYDNLEHVWAVGDCVSLHWPEHMSMGGYRHPDLAHVAHHEAVLCVERICGFGDAADHHIDYKFIPGCTYTHPQVASMGYTEKKAREAGYEIKVGRFPFQASGRALAAGETTGMVKLIFEKKYGELLGVHMVGEVVTELLAELVLARKLEATEAELIEAMHPHPTYSEAVMEAAGVADGRAIHISSPRK